MKRIPAEFNKNGYHFRLVRGEGTVAIYEQSKAGNIFGYEVHKTRIKPSGTAKYRKSNGSLRVVNYPEREVLASNEDFGKYGWSYEKLEDAIKKFEELRRGDRK